MFPIFTITGCKNIHLFTFILKLSYLKRYGDRALPFLQVCLFIFFAISNNLIYFAFFF